MEYVDAIRRHWLLALLVLLAVMVPTALVNVLAPSQYTATTRLWVGVRGGEGITDLNQKVAVAADLMTSYPELVRSPLVLGPVITELGLSTDPAALSKRVTGSVTVDTLILNIQATDESPARAAEIANAVADQFRTVVQELPQVRAGGAERVDTTVMQPAIAPSSPSAPQIYRNVGVAFVLGVVLAVIVCLVIARYLPDGRAPTRSQTTNAVPNWE